jgi:hypothetical protein
MPRWSLMYFGLLIALAFLATQNVHADGRRGKTRYYAPPVLDEPICRGPVRGLGMPPKKIGPRGSATISAKATSI